MSEVIQKWIIIATSIMLGLGIIGAVVMVVTSKRKNDDAARPYPIQGREVVQVAVLPVIIYALVVLAVAGQLESNGGLLGIFGTIVGFIVGKGQISKEG